MLVSRIVTLSPLLSFPIIPYDVDAPLRTLRSSVVDAPIFSTLSLVVGTVVGNGDIVGTIDGNGVVLGATDGLADAVGVTVGLGLGTAAPLFV